MGNRKSKKAVLFLPYFGKLPNYFQLYLQSCKYNKDFDWLIITDDLTPYEYPDNVIVINHTFEDIKAWIQSKFDFEISLKRPYKLCDYRPAFGYIFEQYIAEYDFWGCADPDCIWGDLSKYITWDLLDQFDKLFLLGHLTIYRNTWDNNTMFMRPLHGVERYKEVFSSSNAEQFDEGIDMHSINDIYSYYHIPVYEDKNRADVYSRLYNIRLTDYKGLKMEQVESAKFQFFEWNIGKLYNVSYTYFGFKKHLIEHSYLHLHGERKMKYKENLCLDHFCVFRNRFLNCRKQLVFVMYLDYMFILFVDFIIEMNQTNTAFVVKNEIKKLLNR